MNNLCVFDAVVVADIYLVAVNLESRMGLTGEISEVHLKPRP